jgi:hypothetical protein
MRNIGYHTRLNSDNSVKLVGGSFGGQVDEDTINRLVSHHFTVKIKPSGTPVFVDTCDREVNLYISVDPKNTAIGKIAIEKFRIEECKRIEELEKREAAEAATISDLMSTMTFEEIVARLS